MDTSSDITRLAGIVLDASNAAIERMGKGPVEPAYRKGVADEIKRMEDAAAELAALVGAEGNPPLESSNGLGWDFVPWLQDKSETISEGVEIVSRYARMDPASVSSPHGAAMTPEAWINQGMMLGLETARHGARSLFALVFDDRIGIKRKEQQAVVARTGEELKHVMWHYEYKQRINNATWNRETNAMIVEAGVDRLLSDYLTANGRQDQSRGGDIA